MSEVTIDSMVKRWTSSSRPLFKNKLISEDNCCCAQGDVLVCSGRTFDDLRLMKQAEADREVAKILRIPLAQAILLRVVNDRDDGCPQDVLSNPEKILGPEAHRVLNFWAKLDCMTPMAWDAAGIAATAISAHAAGIKARAEAGVLAGTRAGAEASRLVWDAASYLAWNEGSGSSVAVAGDAALAASRATSEIQGHRNLDKLFFLPMFGINKIEDLDQMS